MRLSVHVVVAAIALSLAAMGSARAEPIKISVFGGSVLYGSGRSHSTGRIGGVPVAEALPAKLERALRARGWDVVVSNNSVPGRSAAGGVDAVFQIRLGTTLTIVRLGGIDRYDFHASLEQIATHLSQIIDAVHQKGSGVILAQTSSREDAMLEMVETTAKRADLFVHWWNGLYMGPFAPRPEYDAGDGEHLNAAGIDIVVARAVPDVERVLTALGLRPGS
jgi:acyl-CoA thioesterase-1